MSARWKRDPGDIVRKMEERRHPMNSQLWLVSSSGSGNAGLANARGQRYALDYVYDTEVAAYLTDVC